VSNIYLWSADTIIYGNYCIQVRVLGRRLFTNSRKTEKDKEMSVYSKSLKPSVKPQTEKQDKKQKKNNAGGYSFHVSDWDMLDRFLVLGCEGGTYYVGEQKMINKSVKCLDKCVGADYKRAADLIESTSLSGRAIKNDPAIFCLAVMSANKNAEIRQYALSKLNTVCRTGTHLFQFVDTVNSLRGWGRGLREAVSNWYLAKSNDKLAYQVSKYKQRDGWSHRDVLRLAHPKPDSEEQNEIFRYVVTGQLGPKDQPIHLTNKSNKDVRGLRSNKIIVDEYQEYIPLNEYLVAVEELKTATEKRQIELIKQYSMPWEVLPTESLNSVKIWEALLQDMPMTAMIRNLGKMSSIGLLKPLSSNEKIVREALLNEDNLKKARLHPFSLLLAYKNYGLGHGFRGSLSWSVNNNIVSSLEDAYYLAFNYVEPSKQNFLFGIDVSGSMSSTINNTNIRCCEASACLAMTSMRTEPYTYAYGFCHQFVNLDINKNDSLNAVVQKVYKNNFGGTDCALPMTYATKNNLEVDVFVVLTDNETYYGNIHPHTALEQYRQKSGRNAKLIVVGMTGTRKTIADPDDPRQIDIAGFDANCPQIISEIAKQ
jgi:60 kDa SS-A/Ro ribonucleoprotein